MLHTFKVMNALFDHAFWAGKHKEFDTHEFHLHQRDLAYEELIKLIERSRVWWLWIFVMIAFMTLKMTLWMIDVGLSKLYGRIFTD